MKGCLWCNEGGYDCDMSGNQLMVCCAAHTPDGVSTRMEMSGGRYSPNEAWFDCIGGIEFALQWAPETDIWKAL